MWRFSLDTDAALLAKLCGCLDQEERHKAERLHREELRRHYIASHGVMRVILARYLGMEPGQLVFRYGEHGKPALCGEADRLHFNLSHSRGLALLAVAPEREVGVDLEYMRPDMAALKLAERFFTAAESHRLKALPRAQRRAAFFFAWTRKEALLKAMGKGISRGLRRIEVSLSADGPLAWSGPMKDEAHGEWGLRNLPPIADYAAALAAHGRDWALRCWQWEPGHEA